MNSSSARNRVPASPGKCSRILVTGVANTTTEETLRDFFAFCGEISMLHLYVTESGKKEAVIKFTAESAASTACLLTNALVDGATLKIDLFPPSENNNNNSSGSTPSNNDRSMGGERYGSSTPVSNDSFTSIFSGIASSGRAFASSMATKVKAFDQQYKVSDTVVSGATTAWNESKRLATDIDTKYRVSESVSSAVKSTKDKVMEVAGHPATNATATSPTPSASSSGRIGESNLQGATSLNRSTSPSKFN